MSASAQSSRESSLRYIMDRAAAFTDNEISVFLGTLNNTTSAQASTETHFLFDLSTVAEHDVHRLCAAVREIDEARVRMQQQELERFKLEQHIRSTFKEKPGKKLPQPRKRTGQRSASLSASCSAYKALCPNSAYGSQWQSNAGRHFQFTKRQTLPRWAMRLLRDENVTGHIRQRSLVGGMAGWGDVVDEVDELIDEIEIECEHPDIHEEDEDSDEHDHDHDQELDGTEAVEPAIVKLTRMAELRKKSAAEPVLVPAFRIQRR